MEDEEDTWTEHKSHSNALVTFKAYASVQMFATWVSVH